MIGGRFAGQAALVTGAARGIGLACARRLAAEGARVVLLDVLEPEGTAAALALRGEGLQADFVACDAGAPEDLAGVVASMAAGPGIDICVCAAGIGTAGVAALDLSADDFDRVHRVNLRGPLLLSQAVGRHMVQTRRRGSIIAISSVAAVLAAPDQAAYCISKAGLAMMVKVLAVALAPHGIRVNAVGPGPVRTEMSANFASIPGAMAGMMARTPLGRMGDVEEVAGTVAFLASHDADFITGQTVYADGGRLALNHIMRQPPA